MLHYVLNRTSRYWSNTVVSMLAEQQLTRENADEFWTKAWEHDLTAWRGAESAQPFYRNLYLMAASSFSTSNNNNTNNNNNMMMTAAPRMPVDLRETSFEEASAMHSGPEERAAVLAFLKGKRILVPLCGDTPVIPFFAAHGVALVVGADLSAQALRAQMKNNFPGVTFTSKQVEAAAEGTTAAAAAAVMVMHEATVGGCTVRLFEGSFLELPRVPEFSAEKVDFVYDRASMMAMEPSLRRDYVGVVAGVLVPGSPFMVERPVRAAGDASGPPFAFSTEELTALYEAALGGQVTADTLVQYAFPPRAVPLPAHKTAPLYFEFIRVCPRV